MRAILLSKTQHSKNGVGRVFRKFRRKTLRARFLPLARKLLSTPLTRSLLTKDNTAMLRTHKSPTTRAAATAIALLSSVSLLIGQTQITAPPNKYKISEDVQAGREAAQ